MNSQRDAFTLVELLVVIAIIGTLVALLLPAVQAARAAAARSQCANSVKQIGLALLNHHDARRCFPAGYVANMPYVDGATDTTPGWSWAAYTLPYLEEMSLYKTLNLNLPPENPVNANAIATRVGPLICPMDLPPDSPFAVPDAFGNTLAMAAPASYVCCVGSDAADVDGPSGNGIFYRNSRTRIADISDGTSKTILAGEHCWAQANGIWAGAIDNAVCLRGPQNVCPGSPNGSNPAPMLVLAHAHLNIAVSDTDGGLDDYSSQHVVGSNFVFADGSVHFIRDIPGDNADGSYTPDSLIFQGLGTRAGGEPIPGDWAN